MPNDDYIKRSDALHELLSIPKGNWSSKRFADAIEAVPAADVEPVRRGRWVEQEEWGDTYYTCSVCKGDFVTLDGASPEDNNMLFCPMCGARMDEEDENA